MNFKSLVACFCRQVAIQSYIVKVSICQ